MTTFNEISTREKELKNAFWENFGFDYLTPLNIKLLAIELDSVLRNSTETPCYSDKIIESGAEKGVWLSSHYFKNREGVVFSMDSSLGIRFAGWASFSNLELVLLAFGNWLQVLSEQFETVTVDPYHNPHEAKLPKGTFDKMFEDDEEEDDGF